MFRQFIRVVEKVQPRFFIMENVKGVLSAAFADYRNGTVGYSHPE